MRNAVLWQQNASNYSKYDTIQNMILSRILDASTSFNIGNISIESEETVKLLGVTVDSSLNFNCHIQNLRKKKTPDRLMY